MIYLSSCDKQDQIWDPLSTVFNRLGPTSAHPRNEEFAIGVLELFCSGDVFLPTNENQPF